MDGSILNSIKGVLGIDPTYTAFDMDVLIHINSAFSTLNQLGVGPVDGFSIADNAATWDAFLGDDPRLNSVISYVYLKVRLVFDPPGTSFLLAAFKEQIQEFEWRLNVQREATGWTDPNPAVVTP